MDFTELREAILDGSAKQVSAIVTSALEKGELPEKILSEGLIKGMDEVGELFSNNEIYVPEVLISVRAMKTGLEILKPQLALRDIKPVGVAVIGTVKDDLHDIGKNLVAMMLEGTGFEVIDAGVNVSAEQFLSLAKEHNAKIVCMSALLTTTMSYMKEVIEAFKADGYRDKVKIMVGGAPLSQKFADEIGADAYTSDAASAAKRALELLNE
ncbi:MAG: corrinoid protein [Eubacteriales bacterium]|nr:corrinoid protein [Eubacteriales bacterium]